HLLTYSLIFNYFRKPRSKSKKIQFYIITIFVIIIFSIASLRLFSGDEDTWLCQNGQWIKHGNPDFPSPSTECLK
ncbi:hypothetical protein KJ632_04160, partial [Patescibacteria group bacterium]|nr:hypothetical protein [Patescibacteria group bacterium]